MWNKQIQKKKGGNREKEVEHEEMGGNDSNIVTEQYA